MDKFGGEGGLAWVVVGYEGGVGGKERERKGREEVVVLMLMANAVGIICCAVGNWGDGGGWGWGWARLCKSRHSMDQNEKGKR